MVAVLSATRIAVVHEPASTALPPGPRLPRWVQGLVMLRYAPSYLAACEHHYGRVFTVRAPGLGTMVYVTDPAVIKSVFAGSPSVFHAGEANSMLRRLLGDTSLLVVDDEVHRDRRRMMLAPFGRDAVAHQSGLMADIAAARIAEWPVGRSFAVAPKISEITLEVILRTVIGATDPVRLAALRQVMPLLLDMGSWDTLALAKPGLLSRGPWRRLRRRIAEADELLYAEIAERRADPDLATRTDALAMLIRDRDDGTVNPANPMTDRELRDQLMTLLVAGHDTTATGLAWALERLTRHPAALARAVRAADASCAGDPSGDEYLDAVAKETLRIRPVVFDVGRILTEPIELAGYWLPAGVVVTPGIGLVHGSAAVYPDPGRFHPDRMLGATLSPTTWLPFGGGNRRCLGATFAMVEMRVVLREVLRRVALSTTTATGEKQRLKHVTLVPHRGGRIRVRAIRNVAANPRAPTPPAECPAARGASQTRA